MEIVYLAIGIIVGGLVFAGLQRKFSSETLANGFMSCDKAETIAPTIFKKDDKNPKH